MRPQTHYAPLLAFFLLIGLAGPTASAAEKDVRLFTLGNKVGSHPMAEKMRSLYPLVLNPNAIHSVATKRPDVFTLELPLSSGEVKILTMKRSKSVEDIATTMTTGKKSQTVDPGVHYRARGQNWMATLSLIKDARGTDQLIGVYSEVGKGNWVIGKSASLEKHYIFNENDLPARNAFHCGMEGLADNARKLTQPIRLPSANLQAAAIPCQSIKVFVEADYKSYVDNGRSVAATVSWIYSVFNVIGAIYENEEINLEVTETYLNTLPDNYDNTSSFGALDQFGDSVLSSRTVSANLAHLLSTENTGLGGVAYLDAVCDDPGTGFSNCDFDYAQLPTYSWTANVIAHELGHNVGSPHTQWCGWEVSPGVFRNIDSCYTTEGGCYTGPEIAREGTIMSYCHLNGSVNLALGFGPLPGALIKDNFNNSTCLSPGMFLSGLNVVGGDTICPGNNVTITPSLVQGATYVWEGPNNFVSNQRVLTINNIQANQAGTYYLNVEMNGCSINPRPVYLHLDCIPVDAISQPLNCGGQTVSVSYSTTYPNAGGNTFYVELSNAAGQFSGNNYIDTITGAAAKGTLTFSLPAAVATGSGYKVRLVTPSPLRVGSAVPVAFIIGNKFASPTGTGNSRSTPGPVTISATSPNAAIFWYDSPTSTTVLGTGNNFTTPSLTATKTYYAEANAGVKYSVGHPGRDVSNGGSLNNYSHGLFFTVIQPLRLDSFTVYPNSAGSLVITITRLGNYDKVFTRTITVSPSANGVKVPVMANLPPGSYLISPDGSTVSSMFRSTGGTTYPYTVSNLVRIDSSTAVDLRQVYYYYFYNWRVTRFGCASARTPVVATIGTGCTPPLNPTSPNRSRCGPGTLNLVASGAQTGQAYRWYNVPTGGTPVSLSPTYTTPNLYRRDTFYVALVWTADPICQSSRMPVIVSVDNPPANPTVTNQSRCGAGTLTLTASGATGSQTYSWYDQATGGTALASGASFTTPSLSRTDTFYVTITNSSCVSIRKMVIATIVPPPAAPTAIDVTRCGPGQDTLIASGAGAGQGYAWYADATSSTVLSTSPNYVTPLMNPGSEDYFVAITQGSCVGPREQVFINVVRIPSAPTTTTDSVCGPGRVTLSAGGARTGEQYAWYSNPSGGNPIPTTPPGDTLALSLTASDTLYVALASAPGCYGPRTPVIGRVDSIPRKPIIVLPGDSLMAQPNMGNTGYVWYNYGIPIAGQNSAYLPVSLAGVGRIIQVQYVGGPCPSPLSDSAVVTASRPAFVSNGIKLYPNPFALSLTLELTEALFNLALTDPLGRTVWRQARAEAGSQSIPTDSLSKGMYLLTGQRANGQVIHRKAVKH